MWQMTKAYAERRREVTGARLRVRRKAAGLTQEELAMIVGVLRTAISDWERGWGAPGDEMVERLERVLSRED